MAIGGIIDIDGSGSEDKIVISKGLQNAPLNGEKDLNITGNTRVIKFSKIDNPYLSGGSGNPLLFAKSDINKPVIIKEDLILYLDVNNTDSYLGGGTTSLIDLSISNNNGTIQNGLTVSNIDGINTLYFDGVDDQILLSSTISISEWSVSYWYKFNISTSNLTRKLLVDDSGTDLIYYKTDIFGGADRIHLTDDNTMFVTGNNYKYQDEVSFMVQKIWDTGIISTTFSLYIYPSTKVVPIGSIGCGLQVESGGTYGYYGGTNLDKLTKINLSDGTAVATNSSLSTNLSAATIGLDEANGKLYQTGQFISVGTYSYVRFARFNTSDLSLDTSFDTSGGGFNAPIVDMAIDSNGKIYCIGTFTTYKGVTAKYLIRLNDDGTRDTGFTYSATFGNNRLYSIKVDNNDKPIIGGDFLYDGYTRMVRLNTDGTTDTSFNIGTGFNSRVVQIDYDSTLDRIYSVGWFGLFNGNPSPGFACLSGTGSLVSGFSDFNDRNHLVKVRDDSKIIVGDANPIYMGSHIKTYGTHSFSSFILLNDDGSIDTSFDAGIGYTEATYRGRLYITGDGALKYSYNPYSIGSRLKLDDFREYYNDNEWHYATLTKDSSNILKIYENCTKYTQYTLSGITPLTNIKSIITTENLSNLQIYDRVLTGDEIVHNFNVDKDLFNGKYVLNGLISMIDINNPYCYDGSTVLKSTINGTTASIFGTYGDGYSFDTLKYLYLSNTSYNSSLNVSGIRFNSLSDIHTVSLWYQTYNNRVNAYLLDGRTGGTGGDISINNIGSNWSSGKVYVNGVDEGIIDFDKTSKYRAYINIVVVANTPFTDDLNLFSSYLNNSGSEVFFVKSLIYNRELSAAEVLQNFYVDKPRFNIRMS